MQAQLRFCAEAGCNELVRRTRCDLHKPERFTKFRQSPGRKRGRKFYDTARWRRVSKRKLTRNPLCEECKRQGVIRAADEVDHVLPLISRPDLSLDFANLQSLCKRCHGRKRD